MKIRFIGATRTVTGACFLCETLRRRFLVDCGMFQGGKTREELTYEPFPFEPGTLDFVLLTHAHIDHSGLLPKLVKHGFRGRIFATRATAELLEPMLMDSAEIQEADVRFLNKKRVRQGKKEFEPVYSKEDVVETLGLLKGLEYGESVELVDGIVARWIDAGHILGSASILIRFPEEEGNFTVCFSGDIGQKGVPIIKDPVSPEKADYLLIESTYGDKVREKQKSREDELAEIIRNVSDRKGKLIIPSFAVGRTQELLYSLSHIFDRKRVNPVPVFVDSPLATNLTDIFRRHAECFDTDMKERLLRKDDPLSFPGLEMVRDVEKSKALNRLPGPAIIIASSGMCNAGRIVHHLRNELYKPENTVLFIGYQAAGTLGRRILDGEKQVVIHGDKVTVRAEVLSLPGFSAHADREGLLEWFENIKEKPSRVFVVHGEEEQSMFFAAELARRFGVEAIVPERLSTYEIRSRESMVRQPTQEEIKQSLELKRRKLEAIVKEFNEMARAMLMKIDEILKD